MNSAAQIVDHSTGLIINDDHALVPLSEVESFLATRPPVEPAKELRDRLAALCTYYKGKVGVYNELYEGQLRTERYIGRMLKDRSPARGNQHTKVLPNTVLGSTPTLADLGLTDMQSSRLQQIAGVSEERFNKYIAAKKEAAERIVKSELLSEEDFLEAYERQIQEAEYVPTREEQRRQQIQLITGSSETNEWYTPKHIIDLAREVLGDIDFDPASSAAANEVVKAPSWCSVTEDGFNQPWHDRVWLNPPYGREEGERDSNAARWAHKLIVEHQSGRVDAAILLVKAALGYNWFEELWREYPTCLLRERLSFTNAETGERGQAKHATALLYFGQHPGIFRAAFRPIGRVIMPDDD